MVIKGVDHIVFTVDNIETSINFYTEILGMKRVVFGSNRQGLLFGNQKINLHEKGREFEPKAIKPTCGAIDICFIADSTIESIKSELESKGIEIIEGIVPKTGATGPIRSVYFRDPDANLIEISTY